MQWYKLALKNIKEALRSKDLYDFYLIASLQKDDMYQEFKRNPEAMYYLVDKLEKLKTRYVKDGIVAINHELKYISGQIGNDPNDLPKAIDAFNNRTWEREYGGPAWGDVATSLNEIYGYPSLYDTLNSNNINFIVDAIYDLIFLIDHFNDVCHNNGRALRNMMKDMSHSRVDAFLDYKRDTNDLRTLMNFYTPDNELVEMLQGIDLEVINMSAEDAYKAAVMLQHKGQLDEATLNKLESFILQSPYTHSLFTFTKRFAKDIENAHVDLLFYTVEKLTNKMIFINEVPNVPDKLLQEVFNEIQNQDNLLDYISYGPMITFLIDLLFRDIITLEEALASLDSIGANPNELFINMMYNLGPYTQKYANIDTQNILDLINSVFEVSGEDNYYSLISQMTNLIYYLAESPHKEVLVATMDALVYKTLLKKASATRYTESYGVLSHGLHFVHSLLINGHTDIDVSKYINNLAIPILLNNYGAKAMEAVQRYVKEEPTLKNMFTVAVYATNHVPLIFAYCFVVLNMSASETVQQMLSMSPNRLMMQQMLEFLQKSEYQDLAAEVSQNIMAKEQLTLPGTDEGIINNDNKNKNQPSKNWFDFYTKEPLFDSINHPTNN